MSDEYTLTVDMATVDSLGRNLYSKCGGRVVRIRGQRLGRGREQREH